MDGLTKEIKDLKEFVLKAEKLGKYPTNTANGIHTAITKAEKGLSSEEPKTLAYFEPRLQELYFRQDLDLSSESVAVYVTRVKRGIADYLKHGLVAGSIYNWQPKLRLVKKGAKKEALAEEKKAESKNDSVSFKNEFAASTETNGVKLNVVSWRLRPGVVIRIELPEDLNDNDVKKIKALLDIEKQFLE